MTAARFPEKPVDRQLDDPGGKGGIAVDMNYELYRKLTKEKFANANSKKHLR